jgi:chemotaxis protein methyltransferase CheR
LSLHGAEFQQLVNLLTINETYFFREPEQIQWFCDTLVPRLMAQPQTRPIRILSAGCSSGEEPYSLAMALHQKYGESVGRLFSLVGGDIDSAVIQRARLGHYSEFSFRGVSPLIRSQYFDPQPHGLQLNPSIRHLVNFYELNLLADSYPEAFSPFDVIFFRNVSIYFDTPTRYQIQQRLASLLNPGGYLILGSAETLANNLGVLPLLEDSGQFYFAKTHPEPATNIPLQRPHVVVAEPESTMSAPATPPGLSDITTLIQQKRLDEAWLSLQTLLQLTPAQREARLLQCYLQIERNEFAAALSTAQALLEQDQWLVDALFLAGLAAKWLQQSEAAINYLKQAVYICHECWPAHYYLAELYRQRAEPVLAQRAYRMVLNLLTHQTAIQTGMTTIPIGLPLHEIRFLCQHQLNQLGERATLLRS